MSDIQRLSNQPPVIIGGTDGSCSQLLAEVLRERGVYMGKRFNFALDNNDFDLCLGGRMTWVKSGFPFDNPDNSTRADITLFKKLYFGQKLSIGDRARLTGIRMQHMNPQNIAFGVARSSVQKIETIDGLEQKGRRKELKETEGCLLWGLKHSASILLLKPLLSVFPKMKFVYLVRDGRDIAVSRGRKVLSHYAKLFGAEKGNTARAAFDTWTRMNEWILETCQENMDDDNFIIIKLEKLCQEPRRQIGRLLKFLKQPVPVGDYTLYIVPKLPATTGAWEEHEEEFKDIDTDMLEAFGYA